MNAVAIFPTTQIRLFAVKELREALKAERSVVETRPSLLRKVGDKI